MVALLMTLSDPNHRLSAIFTAQRYASAVLAIIVCLSITSLFY